MTKTFSFKAKVWLYPGNGAWHFLTLPQLVAREVDFFFSDVKRGWGSLPVEVTLGETVWKTSIFTDKKSTSYILPLKSQVRKQEGITLDSAISVKISITS